MEVKRHYEIPSGRLFSINVIYLLIESGHLFVNGQSTIDTNCLLFFFFAVYSDTLTYS